jgi:two-component system nitrogen regulation sensor histidine kinase NtrY
VVQKVIEDYASTGDAGRDQDGDGNGQALDDVILHWLGRVVGQEILVYQDGALVATSKRELFASGLLTPRLPGEVAEALTQRRMPYVVRTLPLGRARIPVVYTGIRVPEARGPMVVAVPLVLQEQEAARAVEQIVEMLLLATVALGTLLAAAASPLARNVAEPVRQLVDATGRIAAGDYRARLQTRSQDELAELVDGFNAMASALAGQRADLERRRDYMEALLRHATTGVLSTDAHGRLVTQNPAASSLLQGEEGSPRVGEGLLEAVGRESELAPLAQALARPAAAGEAVDVDLVRRGRARRLRVVRVDLPDPAGGPAGTLVLLEDVTDLMRSNQLAAWAEMARAIAHEIKNPLTPIQLSTEHLERLLRDRAVLPSPEIESCLITVIKQVRALREIASEFSAYAKLPDLALRPTDPGQFLRDVVAPYRAAHPPGIHIEEDYVPTGRMAADPKVLARAVVNLIENALQAMPQGGRLRIGVRGENGEVVMSVADTGPGLDPKVRARLFTPYFSTKSSGTGLGLAIVRRAVEAHGGRVEVASVPGRGTTFTIHLPALYMPS